MECKLKGGYAAVALGNEVMLFKHTKNSKTQIMSVTAASHIKDLKIHSEKYGVLKIVVEGGHCAFACPSSGVVTRFFSPEVQKSFSFGKLHDQMMEYVASGDLGTVTRDMHPRDKSMMQILLSVGDLPDVRENKQTAREFLIELRKIIDDYLEQ